MSWIKNLNVMPWSSIELEEKIISDGTHQYLTLKFLNSLSTKSENVTRLGYLGMQNVCKEL